MKIRTAALLSAVALSGCVESALNPDDPVKVKGTALNEDKTPMANVELSLARSANNLCVLTENFAALKTGADGTFSHDMIGKDTQNDNDLARCFVLRLPASPEGARADHDFFIQVQDVSIPNLQLWTGGVAVAATNDGASVTFKSILDTHSGITNPTYGLRVENDAGGANNFTVWQLDAVTSPVALSDYVLEDFANLKTHVITGGETKGSGTTFHTSYGSNKVAITGHNKRPVSRGVNCAFENANPDKICSLTDGKMDSVLAPDNTMEARIQLPTAKVLKKAVFRGFGVPVNFKDVIIEGSADGATFTTLATIADPNKVKTQFFEVDLTGTTAVNIVRIKAVDQNSQPLKLVSAREVSFFE